MTMKLYYHPASPFARKARIAASLLGIELELHLVDLFSGEGQKPEFTRLNPNGKVPTLVDGEFSLWESNAILHYLAAQVPETPLFPADARVRADILRWQFWEASNWAPACGAHVYEYILKPIMGLGEADQAELKKAGERFHRFAKVLEAQLATQPWLTGDAMTFADISVASFMMYAESAHYPVQDYPNIRAWHARIEALPAWSETAPPAA